MTTTSPLTPKGLARQYVQGLADLDPWTAPAVVIEQAFVAGYLAAGAEQAPRSPEPPPPEPMAPATATMPSTEGLLPLVHRSGEKPCHKPALYVTRKLQYGEPPDLKLLRLLPDLREPTPLDPPTCGSCGLKIDPYTQRDLDWAPIFDRSLPPIRTGPRPSRPPAPEPSPPAADPESTESLAVDGAPAADGDRSRTEPYPSPGAPGPVTSPDVDPTETIARLQALGLDLPGPGD